MDSPLFETRPLEEIAFCDALVDLLLSAWPITEKEVVQGVLERLAIGTSVTEVVSPEEARLMQKVQELLTSHSCHVPIATLRSLILRCKGWVPFFIQQMEQQGTPLHEWEPWTVDWLKRICHKGDLRQEAEAIKDELEAVVDAAFPRDKSGKSTKH